MLHKILSKTTFTRRAGIHFSIFLCGLILLAIFGLVSCATLQPANSAGKVNGKTINTQDFNAAHRGHFENFMVENGRVPDQEEKKEIHRKTWRNITIHVILKEMFQKYGVSATESETIDTLMTAPPQYIQVSPLFTKSGSFDRELYRQSLLYDNPVNLRPLKRHYYEYLIPIQKLKLKLVERVLLSRKEAKQIASLAASKADVEWHIFDPQNFQTRISDEEVMSFYQTNQDRYSITPHFSLEYVTIPVNPASEDISKAKAKVDSLYAELLRGVNFDDLAKRFSMSPTAASNGDLGYVTLGDLPSEASEAVQKMQVGEISVPVELRQLKTAPVIPGSDRESSSSVIPDPDRESSSSVIPGSDRESSSSVIPGSDRESSSSVIPDPDRESSSSVIPGSDRESIPTNTYPTTTAWVIYQLKEKTKSLYRLSEIRIFPIPGDETREAGRVRAQSVRDLATRFGMERAAEELELEYHLHDKILPESPWIADSQLLSDVQSRLVHLKKDEFLPLHYSSGLSAWVIVRMKEIRNRRVKPLSEVRSDIIRELSDAKRLSDTKSFATNWIDRRASSISQSEDALIARQSTSGMDIKARFMDLPIETILYDALFDHQNKQKPKAYELSGKIVVPIVTQIYSGKVEKTDDETVRRIFINRLDPKWFDYWLEDQIRKADVRIYQ